MLDASAQADATFRVWRRTTTNAEPTDEGEIQARELISKLGEHVLICFATVDSAVWHLMREHERIAGELGLRPILVGPSQHESNTRNALVLIRNGHVVAEWISGGDGDRPHDWTPILSMVG